MQFWQHRRPVIGQRSVCSGDAHAQLLYRSETTDGKQRGGAEKLLNAFKSLYQIAQHPLLGSAHYSSSRREIQEACDGLPRDLLADLLCSSHDLDSFDDLPDITTHKICCKLPHLGHLKLEVCSHCCIRCD